ncbi:MAG: hypothetical protein JO151_16410 [Verrucomicrobia bacterium]|nr:hypothetical protein [Verrucomicrobiota bacterium]
MLWQTDSAFRAFRQMEFVTNVDTSGKDLQLVIGGSAVGGPLIDLS